MRRRYMAVGCVPSFFDGSREGKGRKMGSGIIWKMKRSVRIDPIIRIIGRTTPKNGIKRRTNRWKKLQAMGENFKKSWKIKVFSYQ